MTCPQLLFCSKDPESNRFITEQEKNYLRKEIGVLERDTSLPSTPFKAILTSVPVWAIIISQTGMDFSFYVMTTDLPKYFSDVMRFDVEKNGLYNSLPQMLNFFSAMGFGLISDICINKEYLSVRNTRRVFTSTGEWKFDDFGINWRRKLFVDRNRRSCGVLYYGILLGLWSTASGFVLYICISICRTR